MGRTTAAPRSTAWAAHLQSTRLTEANARDGYDGGSDQEAGAVRDTDLRRVHGYQHPVAARGFEPLLSEVGPVLPTGRRDLRRHHPLDGRGGPYPGQENGPAGSSLRHPHSHNGPHPRDISFG